MSVAVDMDPATDGLQSTKAVAPGETFLVEVLIFHVDDLSAFQCDLSWAGSEVTYNGAALGPFPISAGHPWYVLSTVGEVSGLPDVGAINADQGVRFWSWAAEPPSYSGASLADGSGVIATFVFTRIGAPGVVTMWPNDCHVSYGPVATEAPPVPPTATPVPSDAGVDATPPPPTATTAPPPPPPTEEPEPSPSPSAVPSPVPSPSPPPSPSPTAVLAPAGDGGGGALRWGLLGGAVAVLAAGLVVGVAVLDAVRFFRR